MPVGISIEHLQTGLLTAASLAAATQGWRQRDRRVAWLAAGFGVLATVYWAGLVVFPHLPRSAVWPTVQIVFAFVALFPLCLYCFASSFGVVTRRGRPVVLGACAGLAVGIFRLPRLRTRNFQPLSYKVWEASFAAVWVTVAVFVAVGLWRAGRRLSPVVRWRMRLLAASALALGVTGAFTMLAGLIPALRASGPALKWLLVASSVFVLVALFPPAWMRVVWRRDIERARRSAELELLDLSSAGDLGPVLLPYAVRVVGGTGAVLIDRDGAVLDAVGLAPGEARLIAQRATADRSPHVFDDLIVAPLRIGWVAVRTSSFAPFRGPEELDDLVSLATFADLAVQAGTLQRLAVLISGLETPADIARQIVECARGVLPIGACDLVLAGPDDPGFGEGDPVRIPLDSKDNRRVGELRFAGRPAEEWTSADIKLAQALGTLAGPALGHAETLRLQRAVAAQRAQVAEEAANVDALTGLGSRRMWDRALAEAEAHCDATGAAAAVVMIDLDELKRTNDTQGHSAGDDLLRRAAGALRAIVRPDDVVCRLGGDEFGLLLVDCEHDSTVLFDLRVSEALARADVAASVGMAWRLPGESLNATVMTADIAMYRVKATLRR